MRGKSIALLVLALGCGLVASLGITQVLAKRGETAPVVETVPVCVATADIAADTLLTPENSRIEQWPKDKAPAGAIAKPADMEDRRTKFPVISGQTVVDKMLLPRGERNVEDMIPKGMRVVTVPVDIVSVAGGLVRPGARCDILVFMHSDNGIGVAETLTKTILQDIRVFAVNDTTSEVRDPKDPEPRHSFAAGKTVSLLVTPAQAEIVTLASQLGTLRLNLRNADDKGMTKVNSTSARELMGLASSGSNRSKDDPHPNEGRNKLVEGMTSMIKESAKPNARLDELIRYKIRVRRGTNVDDFILSANQSAGVMDDDLAWTTLDVPVYRGSDSTPGHTADSAPLPGPNGAPGADAPGGAKPQGGAPLPPAKVTSKPPMGA